MRIKQQTLIKPWEKLNVELINQNSIDKDISDITSLAQDLAIKISHFPELLNQKHLRTNKNSDEFTAIVDVADTSKHGDLGKENRKNKLTVSSLFEGNDKNTFRFIRNKIIIEHSKFGKQDFLEVAKKAVQFLIIQLNLPIKWSPNILEAPNIFTEKVFLNIFYTHQIAWTGLGLEFVRRNSNGDLVHYDPKSWNFELRSPLAINSNNYHDFIQQLIKRSIENNIEVQKNILLNRNDSSSKFIADFFFIDIVQDKRCETIVKILEEECTLSDINEFQTILLKTGCDRLLLISKTAFSNKIKQEVSKNISNIFLISVNANDAENAPLDYFKINYIHTNPKITAIHNSILGILKEDEHLFVDLKGKSLADLGNNFSIDKTNLISFNTLCLRHIKRKKGNLKGTTTINYKPRDETHLYYKIGENFVKVGLEVEFEWEIEEKSLLMQILSFDKNSQGVSIWNLETHIETHTGFQQLKIPVIKYGDTSAVGMLM